MKIYKILGRDCVHADSFGLYLHRETAEQEAQRLQRLHDTWDNDGIDPPEEDRRVTSYYTFDVVELEVKE